MKTLKKALPVLLITATFGTSSAMAAGNSELIMQQLGSVHLSKVVMQNTQQKELQFENSLNSKLNAKLEKSMQEIQKQIDDKLTDQLGKK